MKKFNNCKMVLFDSTNAKFRLAVEAQFVRGNMEQGFRDLVYVTDKYSAMLNPNIYLTLAYKDDDTTPLYTSYPQLFRLREAFEKVKNMVTDDAGFVTDKDGMLTVAPQYTDPVVVANIGKNNNWISLKLAVSESGENGVVSIIPVVSIELSTSNRYAAILTLDEFLTVYTIIKDLNLSTLQCMMSMHYLHTNGVNGNQQQYPGYPTAAPSYYPQQPQQMPMYPPQPNGGYQMTSGAVPQNNWGQNPSGYSRPKFNSSMPRQSYRTAPPAPTANSNPAPTQQQPAYTSPVPGMMGNNQAQLTPRQAEKPILNMKSVDETPVSQINFDDDDALDALFDKEVYGDDAE